MKFWELKQSADKPKHLELYLYGDIEGDGYNFWTGETVKSETSANAIREAIAGYGEIDSIDIYINSYGGSCYEGHAIANILRRCKAKTTAYVDAFACSVASVIACACDEVVMPRNTVMMIHNAWTYAAGGAAELRKQADDLDILNAAFMTVYHDKANGKLSLAKLREMLDAETYLTAEQAFEYGLCDRIEQYDAELKEPTDDDRNAAAKQHIDLDRVCAMVRGVSQGLPTLQAESQEGQISGNGRAGGGSPLRGAAEMQQTDGNVAEKQQNAPGTLRDAPEKPPNAAELQQNAGGGSPQNGNRDAFAEKAAAAIFDKMKFFI